MPPSTALASTLIPVFDVRGGHVVRAVAGNRAQYQPVKSRWTQATEPCRVADAVRRPFGFTTCYLADLDGITHGAADFAVVRDLTAAGWQVWVDAGLRTTAELAACLKAGASRAILASECLTASALARLVASVHEPRRLAFSLDLDHGRVRSPDPRWQSASAVEVVADAAGLGITQVIVLDLAAVGMGGGPGTLTVCQELRRHFPSAFLLSGGGVRSWDDVASFRAVGVDRVLVASALHDGSLSIENAQANSIRRPRLSDSTPTPDGLTPEG